MIVTLTFEPQDDRERGLLELLATARPDIQPVESNLAGSRKITTSLDESERILKAANEIDHVTSGIKRRDRV